LKYHFQIQTSFLDSNVILRFELILRHTSRHPASYSFQKICHAQHTRGMHAGQHTATLCNTLQHTAAHCNTVQHSATLCNTLQHTATHCNTLRHSATHCNTLRHPATHCNTLQHSATHCNTLQHTATHCQVACMWNTIPYLFLDSSCF